MPLPFLRLYALLLASSNAWLIACLQADLDAFHACYLPTAPKPASYFPYKSMQLLANGSVVGTHQASAAAAAAANIVAAAEAEVEDHGLGYYADGVKRTLSDESIAVMRHSEIMSILAERRQRFELHGSWRSPPPAEKQQGQEQLESTPAQEEQQQQQKPEQGGTQGKKRKNAKQSKSYKRRKTEQKARQQREHDARQALTERVTHWDQPPMDPMQNVELNYD